MSKGIRSAAAHQMICAHCTKETSALFRATGPGRHDVAGYSVRATSLVNDVNEQFNTVRPFFQYHLPQDTCENGRYTVDESSAPRRLVYAKIGDAFLIGHVVYQERDVTGHPAGSYLAHFLLPTAPIATCDVLTLWGAMGWADRVVGLESLPHTIPPLQDIAELWALHPGHDSCIGRTALQEFLTAPRSSLSVVPERWRGEPPERRQQLLVTVLQLSLIHI